MSRHPDSARVSLPPALQSLPAFFVDILRELARYQSQLGGLKNFPDYPKIKGKVTAEDLKASYTDYEYVFLQVVGFANLHQNLEEIVAKNNGKGHGSNPGTQLLERLCGMTMHGDRAGAVGILRSAGPSMLEAFQVSKTARGGTGEFFKSAFDRKADPCLEGRVSRLLEYLEKHRHGSSSSSAAPWEDVSLRPLPKSATPTDIVGEHLRVFMGDCTWRWAASRGLSYEQGKEARLRPEHAADFERVFNARTFEAAMRSKGVVADSEHAVHWEMGTRGEKWVAYDASVNATINAARGHGRPTVEVRLPPHNWTYQIDMRGGCQRNIKSGKEHKIRCVKGPVGMQWEACISSGEQWTPYDESVSIQIERAYQAGMQELQVHVGPKSWRYDIDLAKSVQRNPDTGKERAIRRMQSLGVPTGKVAPAQLAEAIKYFVDLCTLPEAPAG